MFLGYMLVYAAVADGGKFATDPWSSLWADAYTTPLVAADQSVVTAAQAAGAAVSSSIGQVGG